MHLCLLSEDRVDDFINLDHNIWIGYTCITSVALTRYMRGVMLTRIFTLPEYRKNRYASQALDKLCSNADLFKMPIYLEIASDRDGGLDNHELAEFYEKRGFVNMGGSGVYVRRPK